MECDVFPCSICDNIDESVCSADALKRNVNDIPCCPLSTNPSNKPDIGHWVVKQPDGLFCYYNETSGMIEGKDMTLQEIILHREKTCRMSYEQAERDTLAQVEFQVVRWEDVTR